MVAGACWGVNAHSNNNLRIKKKRWECAPRGFGRNLLIVKKLSLGTRGIFEDKGNFRFYNESKTTTIPPFSVYCNFRSIIDLKFPPLPTLPPFPPSRHFQYLSFYRRKFNQRIGKFAEFLFSKSLKTILCAERLSTPGLEFWLGATKALDGKKSMARAHFFSKNQIRFVSAIFRNSAKS